MKITKRGTPKSERIWKGCCRSCGTEATATENELNNIREHQIDGFSSWEVCPVCNGGMLFFPDNKEG